MPATDPGPPSEEDGRPKAGRSWYGLGQLLSDGWTIFRREPGKWLWVFCALHLIAAFIPLLIFFEIPDDAALAVVLLVRVVLPVIAGTVAVAVAVRFTSLKPSRESKSPEGDEGLGARWADLLALALFASILGVALVLFLGAYGFLVLHLTYGPPIAIQVFVRERADYRDSLSRARSLFAGNWRTLIYLFVLSILIGLIAFVVVGGLYSTVADSSDLAGAWALSIGQALVLGALTAFLGATQTALYEHLIATESGSEDGDERARTES